MKTFNQINYLYLAIIFLGLTVACGSDPKKQQQDEKGIGYSGEARQGAGEAQPVEKTSASQLAVEKMQSAFTDDGLRISVPINDIFALINPSEEEYEIPQNSEHGGDTPDKKPSAEENKDVETKKPTTQEESAAKGAEVAGMLVTATQNGKKVGTTATVESFGDKGTRALIITARLKKSDFDAGEEKPAVEKKPDDGTQQGGPDEVGQGMMLNPGVDCTDMPGVMLICGDDFEQPGDDENKETSSKKKVIKETTDRSLKVRIEDLGDTSSQPVSFSVNPKSDD